MLDSKRINLGRAISVSVPTMAGLALFIVAGVLLVAAIFQLRSDALEEARKDVANLALVLGEQSARAVQTIDLALRDLQDSITETGVETTDAFAQLMSSERFHRELQDKTIRLSYAEVFAIVDSNGRIVNSSRELQISALIFRLEISFSISSSKTTQVCL